MPAGGSRRGGGRGWRRSRWPGRPGSQGRAGARLVERLAGRVVDGLAQEPVREVIAHLDEEGMAAGDDERHEREWRRRALGLVAVQEPCRIEVPLEVVDSDERPPVRPSSVFANAIPTRSEPARPGPAVTAIPSTSGMVTPAVSRTSFSAGTIQRRCARAASSGTIPPAGACSAIWLATAWARIRRPPATSATPVSSQDDSIASSSGSRPLTGRPRAGAGRAAPGPAARRAPHRARRGESACPATGAAPSS